MRCVTDFESAGFVRAQITLSPFQCDHITSSLPAVPPGVRGGLRDLATHPTVLQLLHSKQLGAYLWSVVGRDLVAVKATLLDQGGTEALKRTAWHQDRLIAVRERLDVAGYSSWVSRAGLLEVEPPSSVLEQMLIVSIYLDDSREEDGALRVLPGSHQHGKLDEGEIQSHLAAGIPTEVHVARGTFLLLRPLVLRSSPVSKARGHARVLQIEFAPVEAISPLQWHTAVRLRRAA